MRSLLRTLFVIPQAALVTLLLLVLMVSLIEFSDKSLDKVKRIKLPDIYMPDVEIEIQRLIEKPEKPEVDETPPPDIPEQEFDKIDGNAAVGQVAAPGNMRPKLDLNIGAGLQATDGEYLPIVKVAPQYPRRALSRGIEGYVIVEYTVTKLGTVKDPRVVEGKPQGTFDRAAIKSALRYKYKPRVVDGEPIEVKGVRTRITFELEE
ncbi:MAG: TonB family protein [Proteobacteria bacterium]|nr:TonB family protein [Pseudomonadota bacterium]